MELTIAIPTYRRPDLLRKCLETLDLQTADPSRYEVLVIDNAGQTEVASLAAEYGCRYVHETKTGHSHARNRGLAEARAEWVFYLDDDVLVPANTVQQLLTLLPHVDGAAVGGYTKDWYLNPPPAWLLQKQGPGYHPSAQTELGPLRDGQYLIGCFFGVRKKIVQQLGGFNPRYGMQGTRIGWADETELLYRLRQAGYAVWYASDVYVEHLLQPWKCSYGGQLRHAYTHGRTMWEPEDAPLGSYGITYLFGSYVKTTFLILPVTLGRWLLRHRDWYWQTATLKVLTKYAFATGRYVGQRERVNGEP